MAKVIIFEKDQTVLIATLIDDRKRVCRENFTNIGPCSKELIELFPKEIVEFFMKTAPQFLYWNSEGYWESTQEESLSNFYKMSIVFNII